MSQYIQEFLEKCAALGTSISKCSIGSEIPEVSFWVITSLALIDSINPCAIAVLLILLTTLITAQKKKRVLGAGIAFVIGLFIAYFLFGLGIFSTIHFIAYKQYFHLIVGIFAITVGTYYLYTGIRPPKNAKQVCIGGVCAKDSFSARLIYRITSIPTAFLAGVMVSIFELPCTGGPYILTLGLLSQSHNWIEIIPILLYYNFIFVLPLIILTFVVYWGFSKVEKVGKWKDRNAQILEIVCGALMIGLGIWVIFG